MKINTEIDDEGRDRISFSEIRSNFGYSPDRAGVSSLGKTCTQYAFCTLPFVI